MGNLLTCVTGKGKDGTKGANGAKAGGSLAMPDQLKQAVGTGVEQVVVKVEETAHKAVQQVAEKIGDAIGVDLKEKKTEASVPSATAAVSADPVVSVAPPVLDTTSSALSGVASASDKTATSITSQVNTGVEKAKVVANEEVSEKEKEIEDALAAFSADASVGLESVKTKTESTVDKAQDKVNETVDEAEDKINDTLSKAVDTGSKDLASATNKALDSLGSGISITPQTKEDDTTVPA